MPEENLFWIWYFKSRWHHIKHLILITATCSNKDKEYNLNALQKHLVSWKKYLLQFGSIAVAFIFIISYSMYMNFLLLDIKLSKDKIWFLHFENWQSWQEIMSIFWSWKIPRNSLIFDDWILVQNLSSGEAF